MKFKDYFLNESFDTTGVDRHLTIQDIDTQHNLDKAIEKEYKAMKKALAEAKQKGPEAYQVYANKLRQFDNYYCEILKSVTDSFNRPAPISPDNKVAIFEYQVAKNKFQGLLFQTLMQ